MKKVITDLVTINPWVIVKGSTRGCGIRYVMSGKSARGQHFPIETNPTSPSNTSCSLQGRTSRVFRMTLRSRPSMGWFADVWECSACCGLDLEAAFDQMQRLVSAREQQHGQ